MLFTSLSRNPGDHAVLDQSYFRGLVDTLSKTSGIHSAVFSSLFPTALGFRGALFTDEFSTTGSADATVIAGLTERVSPGFFAAFRISQLNGRDFTWADSIGSPAVAIVSQSLAARLFPGEGAVGKRMRLASGSITTDAEIVGVVADAPIGNLRDPHVAVTYRPMMQDLARSQNPLLHVLVSGNTLAARDAFVSAVESQRHHFVRGVLTLPGWMDFALIQERLTTTVAISAAALASLLACVGIYAALALAVAARAREIALRAAIGASPAAVLRMIVFDGVVVVALGVLVGIPSALGASRLIGSQLYGVEVTDGTTIIGCAALFIAIGTLATLVPALRASMIDPATVLREA